MKKTAVVFRWIRLICLIFFATLFGVLALAVACGTVFVERNFETCFPEELIGDGGTGISPRFYIYRFSDRKNRIGEREELSDVSVAAENGGYAAYPEMPKELIQAFLSIEDKRFWEHHGVDFRRSAAAVVNYVFGRSGSFGGSTVTQQLVKNLTGDNEVSPRRKIQEMLYAWDLERKLDKTEILELYLNVIHFSDRCDGISAAATHYYSKEVGELTLTECASLAAIVNSPSYYNPIRSPEHNLARRNLILSQMAEQGYLSAEDAAFATTQPLELRVQEENPEEQIHSWYLDMVLEDVTQDLMGKYGLSRAAASRLLYAGGLHIEMSMDPELQEMAEQTYRTAVRMPVNRKGESAQSAMILVDPATGDILAVVGAVGEKRGNRVQNFATQTKRPPGSTIKPLSVYAPALESGQINWASVFDDVPVTFFQDNSAPWPRNATGIYRGLTDVSYAVAHSTNTVAVRVLQKLGAEVSYRFLKEKFHLTALTESDRNPAPLALGQLTDGVTLRELTCAYTAFADEGVFHAGRSYYRVTDRNGKILLSRPDGGEVVLSAANASIMTKLLQGVIRDGTSTEITLQKLTECAGKTGTSGEDRDRWFIGYTPELLCGVWCGYEYPEPLTGKNLATSVWNTVMRQATVIRGGKTEFSTPASVLKLSYCRDSGKLPCDACNADPRGNRIAVGYFVKGSEPTESCDCHVLCDYDPENGVSHGNCPKEDLRKVALIHVERSFPMQIVVSDAQYVFRGDPSAMPYSEDPGRAYFSVVISDFCGISDVQKQFNRSCTVHTEREEEPTPDGSETESGTEAVPIPDLPPNSEPPAGSEFSSETEPPSSEEVSPGIGVGRTRGFFSGLRRLLGSLKWE